MALAIIYIMRVIRVLIIKLKDKTQIDITRDNIIKDSSGNYYTDTIELKVDDMVLTEGSVQSEADSPGYEDDTIPTGKYTGHILDYSGTYDDPILLTNEDKGYTPDEDVLIHPNEVTNSQEIERRHNIGKSTGPWSQPYSEACQITSNITTNNELIDELKKLGYQPIGTYTHEGEGGKIYGNPYTITVNISDKKNK